MSHSTDLFHDPFECPDPSGEHCEEARRRILARVDGLGIPGLSPKREDSWLGEEEAPHGRPLPDLPPPAGEPVPLVVQNRRLEGRYMGEPS